MVCTSKGIPFVIFKHKRKWNNELETVSLHFSCAKFTYFGKNPFTYFGKKPKFTYLKVAKSRNK